MSPDEAFAALGDEVRVPIERVLWEADTARRFEDVATANRSVSSSELVGR